MVIELTDGETLAARIEKGVLPLDPAHLAGVTRRDVKPQNIMLTRDGVKVLDFGLAKAPSDSMVIASAGYGINAENGDYCSLFQRERRRTRDVGARIVAYAAPREVGDVDCVSPLHRGFGGGLTKERPTIRPGDC